MVFVDHVLKDACYWKEDHNMGQIDIIYKARKFDSRDFVIKNGKKRNKDSAIPMAEEDLGFLSPSKRSRCSDSDE